MSEKTPQSYIHLARPELIKEWHPTKNGKSNPKNMARNHEEQVWWLCENGHEWEDTVKSRMAGDRCPFCVPELSKKQSQKNVLIERIVSLKEIEGKTYNEISQILNNELLKPLNGGKWYKSKVSSFYNYNKRVVPK